MQMLKLEEQEFLGEATCLLSEVLANGIINFFFLVILTLVKTLKYFI
jgi:hypothetical protein